MRQLVALLIASAPLAAAEYVVDGGAGSDANAGTAAAPFRTIARGCAAVHAGDTLSIHAGTYRESASVHVDGTQASPLTVRAWPGDEGRVIVKGSDLVGAWSSLGGEQWSAPWSASLPPNYPSSWPTPTADELRTEVLAVDGIRLRQVTALAGVARGTYFVDDANHRIVLDLADGSDPHAHRVEVSARQSGLSLGGTWLHVVGLTVMHVANDYNHGAFEVGGDNATVERCAAIDNGLEGLHIAGTGLHALGNVGSGNGLLGMGGNLWSSVVDGNTTDGNSWRFAENWSNGGIKIVGGGPSDNVVSHHVSRDNDGPGIWFDWDTRNNRIDSCYCDDDKFAGITIEASWPGNAIVNCVVRRTRGVHGVPYDYSTGEGICLTSAEGTLVADCTLIDNERYGLLIGGGVRGNGTYPLDDTVTGTIFAGNGVSGVNFWVWDQTAQDALTTHVFDYDLWSETAVSSGDGLEFATLAAWQAHGQDAHGVAGDPRFVDRADGDAHLVAGSPAIDAGTTVAGVAGDRDGVSRPQGARPDIGAYEYVAAAPAISAPATVSATVGTAFSWSITASNAPTSYGATGLPPGLTLDASTGVIAGTPAASGTYSVALTATNAAGTGGATVAFAVAGATRSPYGGSAHAIPGTIQAEDFDNGGEGVAYHDTTPGNLGGGYRSTDVDIRASLDVGGGWQVGWFGPGEWLEYTCAVTTAGAYDIGVRVASGASGATVHVSVDGGDVTGALTFPATGGWDTWTTVTKLGATLASGTHVVRLTCDAGALDCNWLSFAPHGGFVAGGWYTLTAKHSGQLLDVAKASTADGAQIIQWPANGGLNQQWRIDAVGDGTYRLISRNSGKAMDVAGASTADGAPVIQWTLNGGANQRWRLDDVGGGYYRVTSVNSGEVLDIRGGSTAAGAALQQWPWNGGDNQRFQLTAVAVAADAGVTPTAMAAAEPSSHGGCGRGAGGGLAAIALAMALALGRSRAG